MIEILSIFLTLITFLIFSNLPLNFYLVKKGFYTKISYSESMLINLIINCNFLLLLSFFFINLNFIFLIYLIGMVICLLYYLKDFLKLVKKNLLLNIFFLSIFYSISLIITKNAYLEWDGLAHWFSKVSVFYQGGHYQDLVGLTFDYYPHLGSYLWAFFWKNSLIQNEYLGRLFFVFIFLISIFSLNNKLTNKYSIFEKLFIIFLIIYLSTNIFLFGGYQEYFLFFIFFCFSNFFVKFFLSQNKNISNYYPEILLLLIVNTMIWIKQEGFFYFIILIILFVIHARRNVYYKFIFSIASFFLLFIFFYIKNLYFESVRFNDDIINDETFKNLNLSYLLIKISIITKYFFITFFKYPIWLLIIISIFYLTIKSNFFEKYKFVLTYLILTFGFVYMIFLNTTDDVAWLAPLTLNRIVFAISGFLIFICIDFLNKIKK